MGQWRCRFCGLFTDPTEGGGFAPPGGGCGAREAGGHEWAFVTAEPVHDQIRRELQEKWSHSCALLEAEVGDMGAVRVWDSMRAGESYLEAIKRERAFRVELAAAVAPVSAPAAVVPAAPVAPSSESSPAADKPKRGRPKKSAAAAPESLPLPAPRLPRGGPLSVEQLQAVLASVAKSFEGLELPAAEPVALDFPTFEESALRTYKNPVLGGDRKLLLMHLALGLNGEAGEVADVVKKHIGHGHPLDKQKLFDELGDVLWYLAALAHWGGWDFEDVARGNMEKLAKRYPDGFSSAASLARVDVAPSLPTEPVEGLGASEEDEVPVAQGAAQ